MAILPVNISNTFNEFRLTTNEIISQVNTYTDGTGTLNISTVGATTINATTVNSQDVVLTGALKGPATFYIDPSPDDTGEPGGATTDTGTVVILGDLQVNGTTTTINSTTLTVSDLQITLAKDAANASEANTAGILVAGANATLTYASANDRWESNKNIYINGSITSSSTLSSSSVYSPSLYSNTGSTPDGWIHFGDDTDGVWPSGTVDNITVIGSITDIIFNGDGNANGTGGNFYWGYGTSALSVGAQTKTMSLTRSGILDVPVKITTKNISPEFLAFSGGNGAGYTGHYFKYTIDNSVSLGTTWRKVCDVTLGTEIYSALSANIKVTLPKTNYGHNALPDIFNYTASFRRSGGTLNSHDDAILVGQSQDYIRIVKTATGVYELQTRSNLDNVSLIVEVSVTADSDATVVVADTVAAGSTTGTVYTATTTSIAPKVYQPSVVSNEVIIGGTSAKTTTSGITPSLQIIGEDAETSSVYITRDETSTFGPVVYFHKSRNNNGAVVGNDILGSFTFAGSDGTNPIEGATLRVLADGNASTGSVAGKFSFSTAGQERVVIDKAGDLLIGGTAKTSAPASLNKGVYLQSQTNGDVIGYTLYVNDSTTNRRSTLFLDDTNAVYGFDTSFSTGSSAEFVIRRAGTEQVRVDASGNLLVGKNSAGSSNVGVEARPAGYLFATGDGINPLRLNRLTSDGTIAEFQKGGTAVGNIGTNGGSIYLGTSDTGVRFSSASAALVPFNTSTSANRDAAVSLGVSDVRFKDLYLSDNLKVEHSASGSVSLTRVDTSIGVNNSLGQLHFRSTVDSGTTNNLSASIVGLSSQAHTTTAAGGYLTFNTTSDGGTSPTERARLSSSGNFGIGDTNPQRKLSVKENSAGTVSLAAFYNADTTDGNGSVFSFRGDTTGTGATTFYEFAAITGKFNTHDHATRSGSLEFFTADKDSSGTRMTIAGNGLVTIPGTVVINGNIDVGVAILNDGFGQTSDLTETVISSFNANTYASAKYLIQAKDTTTGEIQTTELLVVHNGTTAFATEYGTVNTSGTLATYDVGMTGSGATLSVELRATAASTNNTTYKMSVTYIEV